MFKCWKGFFRDSVLVGFIIFYSFILELNERLNGCN